MKQTFLVTYPFYLDNPYLNIELTSLYFRGGGILNLYFNFLLSVLATELWLEEPPTCCGCCGVDCESELLFSSFWLIGAISLLFIMKILQKLPRIETTIPSYRNKKWQMNKFMKFSNLPWQIGLEIFNFYHSLKICNINLT